MKKLHILALVTALALTFALGGCTPPAQPTSTPTSSPSSTAPLPTGAATSTPAGTAETTPSPTQSPQSTPTAAPEGPAVNVLMLKGPTGMGAAKLMADNDAGTTAQRYAFSVDADPSLAPAKLLNGEIDIAALPTNVAANLYNKNESIQMLALNTLGVLYILGNDLPALSCDVTSLADLEGQTLYATGQGANPEFVLNFLLEQNGLDPAEDVDIVWLSSDELTAKMAGNEIGLCMLPVPAATAVMAKNPNVHILLDLTEEWDLATGDGSVLTMGCVVARAEFVRENPQAVATFLAEYAASIEYVKNDPEDAAQLVARYEITPNAAIAAAAIPQANLVCITGIDMAASIQVYYSVLWKADHSSIGGSVPDDGFYYIP